MQFSLPALFMLVSGALCLGFMVYARVRLRVVSSSCLTYILLLMAMWSVGSALEVMLVSHTGQMIVGRAGYLSYALLPVFWVRFMMEFATHRAQAKNWLVRGMFTLSGAFILLNWFNPADLFYTDIAYEVVDGSSRVVFYYGPAFYVYVAYLYGALVAVMLWLEVRGLRGKLKLSHVHFLIIGVALPLVANALYVTKVLPWDFTSASFLVSILMLWLLYRREFFQELPLSRRKILEAMPDGIIMRNTRGDVMEMNTAARRMLNLLGAEDARARAREVLDDWENAHYEGQLVRFIQPFTHPVNGRCYYRVSVNAVEDSLRAPVYTILTLQDETALYRAEKRIHYLENHDEATGLYNSVRFTEMLGTELELCKVRAQNVALVCFSIVGYSDYCNVYGTTFGSTLKREVGGRVRGMLRQCDAIGHFSGDEFYAYFRFEAPAVGTSALAESVVMRMNDLFVEPLKAEGITLVVRLQSGVAMCPLHSQSTSELINMAHLARENAGLSNTHSYSEYNDSMLGDQARALQIEQSLHTAMERDELYLVYHPQMDARTNRIMGVEALMRWNSPELGLVMPDEFIPVAEKSGLIGEIGLWALRRAVAQAVFWHQLGYKDLRLAVNVSINQLRNQHFADEVMKILAGTGMDPHRLELELTESVALFPDAMTHSQLPRLRERGVRIAMDDFGMGHSSLSYIKQFKLDTVKIDRVLSHDILQNETSVAMIRSVNSLCTSVGLEVVVEYIEQVEQVTLLSELGCNILQGYYYSPPLTSEDCTHFISEHYAPSYSAVGG